MGAHKRNLRKLAFALGVVPRDANSLHMSAEEFEEKLEKIYPDIRDLGDDEVTALIADAEAGGGQPAPAQEKAAPPAKAPKKKPEPEPEAEVEADPEEEPSAPAPAPAPRRGRPAKSPTPPPAAEEEVSAQPAASGPRPAARPAQKPTAAPAAAASSSAELTVLRDMVKDIGTKVFDYEASFKAVASKESVDKLSGEVKELRTTLKAIAGYLTWQYNSQVDESDAVKSILDVAW
jgi:hypothetical protein